MNYLDIIIAVVLGLFAWKGFRKGLIIEVVTLLAFGIGIWGAMHFSDFTAAHLQDVMEVNPKYLNTMAFVLTFILLVVGVNLLGKALTQVVKALNLSFWNKLGGAVFGAAKGVLLFSILLMVMANFSLTGFLKPQTKENSLLFPFVERTVPYVYRGFDLIRDYAREVLPSEREDIIEEETPNYASLLSV